MSQRRKHIGGQPRTRSAAAQAAYMRNGAGTHGGGKREQRRKDRQSTRRELKGYRLDYD